MPTKPQFRQLVRASAPTILVPSALGFLLGGLTIAEYHKPHVVMGMGLTCSGTMLAALAYASSSLCWGSWRAWFRRLGAMLWSHLGGPGSCVWSTPC